MAKYSIVKGKSGKSKKVIVAGVKKVLYKKEGSNAMYVISKKRHIKLTKYKKMKMKGGEVQTGGKKRKGKKTNRIKRGGNFFTDFFAKLTGKKVESPVESQLQVQLLKPVTQGGAKKKKSKNK